MTTPDPEDRRTPDDRQPRDIALEMETSEVAADLEAQSEPRTGASSDES